MGDGTEYLASIAGQPRSIELAGFPTERVLLSAGPLITGPTQLGSHKGAKWPYGPLARKTELN